MAGAVFALAVSPGSGAKASDADLQRALLKAGCVKAEIRQMPSQGTARIFRANCFGSSHRVIEAVCIEGRCMVSPSDVTRETSDDP